MVESSARRRHGPVRDVLRTNVPVAGQPSRRVGWGATARAGGGLPAVVADPVGPRVGNSRLRFATYVLVKETARW